MSSHNGAGSFISRSISGSFVYPAEKFLSGFRDGRAIRSRLFSLLVSSVSANECELPDVPKMDTGVPKLVLSKFPGAIPKVPLERQITSVIWNIRRGQMKGLSMDHVEAFRRNAHECRAMARSTKDPESRATWTSFAERWQHCAEVAENVMASAAENYQRTRKMKQSSRSEVH
jgi:hypothetical protein